MATKLKTKTKAPSKGKRAAKSIVLKAKPKKKVSKAASPKPARRPAVKKISRQVGAASSRPKVASKTLKKVRLGRAVVATKATPPPLQKARSRHFPNALQAYEAGIKL